MGLSVKAAAFETGPVRSGPVQSLAGSQAELRYHQCGNRNPDKPAAHLAVGLNGFGFNELNNKQN